MDAERERIVKTLKESVQSLLDLAAEIEPGHFGTVLLAANARILHELPDDYFDVMTAEPEPCGRVGCNCHLEVGLEAVKFWKYVRKDFRDNKPTTITE